MEALLYHSRVVKLYDSMALNFLVFFKKILQKIIIINNLIIHNNKYNLTQFIIWSLYLCIFYFWYYA